MCFSFVDGTVWEIIFFFNGQGIELTAEHDGRPLFLTPEFGQQSMTAKLFNNPVGIECLKE